MKSYHKSSPTFVPALRDDPPRVEIIDAAPAQLPTPPTTVVLTHAGYADRARGFSLATAPLAGVTGFVAALVGVIGWSVPVASLATLLLALGGFALTWLAAYIAHVLISPDGALFLHTVYLWGYLREDQRERHRLYKELTRGRD